MSVSPHLLRARDLAEARYYERLDIARLADAARLSRAHFARQFHQAFGMPPHQFVMARRMQRAAALLRSTDRSVAEICAEVGLHSVGSFTTRFGQTFGLSPTAYRSSHLLASNRARIPEYVECVQTSLDKAPEEKTARKPRTNFQSGRRRAMVIKHLTHVNVWVRDQNEALDFYTRKLGMEIRDDITLAEAGNYRWLTVGLPAQPELSLILTLAPPPLVDEHTADALRSLMAAGMAGEFHLATSECCATYMELSHRGIEFQQPPTVRPYGVDSLFRDPWGNTFRLVESRDS